jgi:hypothetical protein
MTSEIATLITGIKGTIDIAKGLKSAYDSHTIAEAQTDILERLLAVQGEALTLQERHSSLMLENESLSKKLREFHDWEKQKESFVLKEVSARIYVYVSKVPDKTVANPPYYCSNCFGLKQLSILQYQGNGEDYHKFDCQRCGKSFLYNTGSSGSSIEPLDSSDLNF